MRFALPVAAALPFLATPAFGWGCEGHQIVALIARARLTPTASAAVDQLLTANPIPVSLYRFCKDRPADPMADSSTWADDVKNSEKTGDWHFIDIPVALRADPGREPDPMKWCPPGRDGRPGCILSAMDYEWSVLRSPAQTPAARARALRYLIHFVGDIAQPLHASDNHDRGGNCTSIRFFGETKPRDLHAIWDYGIIERELPERKTTTQQYAGSLDEAFTQRWPDWGRSVGSKPNAAAWAWDSHALASAVVYGKLQPQIRIAPVNAGLADQAACDAGRESVASLHISMGDTYVDEALPVIREQLAKAGYRLAGLLNEAFR